jgi:hypothetical protein
MSIKFSRTAPNPRTRIVIPDSPTSTIPAGDFLIGSVVTIDGTWPPTENNHILTALNSSDVEAGNLRMFLRSDSAADCGGDVYPGSGVDARNPTILAAGSSYFVGMARIGAQLRTIVCPVLTAQPTDASAVIVSTKTRAITTGEMNPPGFVIGERSSTVATTGDRRFDSSISRVFCIVGSVPLLDIAKFAYGMEPADLGYNPLWYVRMNDGMDTTDLGPNALATTRSTGVDPLPTGTSPGFGFVSTNRPPTVTTPVINGSLQVGTAVTYTSGLIDGYPFPVSTQQWFINGVAITGATDATYIPTSNDENKTLTVRQFVKSTQGEDFKFSAGKTIAAAVNALYLTPPPADWMVQHIGGVAPVPFSFTYTGEQPASIEYALYDPDGTLRVTWAAAGATIVPGGTGNATPSMPAGAKKYLLAIRAKRSNGTVIAASATSATRFGVGEVIGMVGSSSAETWGYRITGTVDTDITAQFRDGIWYIPDRETYATKMARYIHSQRGFVVGMIDAGAGGTGLSGSTGWISKTSPMWTSFESAVAASGGKLGGLFVSVGSNDAGSGGVILKSVHTASMRTLIQNARDLTGQANLPVLWSGYNRRSADLAKPNFNASSDAVREAEKLVGTDPYVYHVQALDYELHADGVHLTGPGFLDCTARMAYVWCEALAGRYRRGPKITAFSFAGNDVFIDVTHRNGNDLLPTSGGVGITVTDASGTPAQTGTQRVSATRYKATYDRALVAPVVTKFLSGGAPDWITPVIDNGAVPLPMEVETELATVAGTATVTYVRADASLTWTVNAAAVPDVEYVRADQALAYTVRAYARADATLSWSVQAAAQPVPTGPFTPSIARTIQALPSSVTPFGSPGVGGFWVTSNPKKPYGVKDPDSTIDITIDWNPVFEDMADVPAGGTIVLKAPTGATSMVKVAEGLNGMKQTVFLSGGPQPGDYEVTFRVDSSSEPPRKIDRTVILKVEDQ